MSTNSIQIFGLYSMRKIYIFSIAIMLIVLTVMCIHIWHGAYTGQTLRFADSDNAMITAADGFFYLAQAEHYLAQGGDVSALAMLTATIQNITDFELTNIAFWLPVFLASLLCFVFAAWAILLKFSLSITALAIVIGMLVPAWVERSRMGWFDTDTGITFLWQTCLVSTAFLAMPNRRFSWLSFTFMIISGGLLAWWWKPSMVLLPACFTMWGIAFLWAKDKKEKYLRLFVLLGIIFIAIIISIIFFLMPKTLGLQLSNLLNYAFEHFRLVMGITGNIISNSIQEITSMSINHILIIIGGSPLGGAFIFLSLGLFCIFQRHIAFFLLPALTMLVFGFFSERFIYLGAVPIGLSVAWLTQQIWNFAKSNTLENVDKLNSLFVSWIKSLNNLWSRFPTLPSFRLFVFRSIAVSFATAVLFSQAYWFFNWLPEGYFVNEHDKVAIALSYEAKHNSPVWAWWDDGYFLRARAGLSPMFDGGSQNPFSAAVVARPFMTEDIRFSRRWIRFFALRGINALNPLLTAWGGQNKTWELVEKIFSADQPEIVLKNLPPVKNLPAGLNEWLFPKGQVFIYFSQRILRLSQWWGSIGEYAYPKQEQVKSYIDVFERDTFYYNTQTQHLLLPKPAIEKGYTAVSDVYITNEKPITAPWPKKDGLFAIVSPYSQWLYFANLKGLKSLPLRLMAPAGVNLDGFRLISVNYNYAGAWEVLP